jgi:hypothetical protein
MGGCVHESVALWKRIDPQPSLPTGLTFDGPIVFYFYFESFILTWFFLLIHTLKDYALLVLNNITRLQQQQLLEQQQQQQQQQQKRSQRGSTSDGNNNWRPSEANNNYFKGKPIWEFFDDACDDSREKWK